MTLQKAPQAPEPKEYPNIQDFVGSDIAVKKVDMKMVNTEHGEQRVYIVDLMPLDGNIRTGLYCFWRDIQRQLDGANGWIAGRLIKESYERFDRHIINPDTISDESLKTLSAAIDALDNVPF